MPERKFHERFETWVIVSVITVLVWLYAEATVLQQQNGQAIQLRFTAATSQDYAIEPAGPVTVRVSFEASSGQYQQFRQLTNAPLPIELEPSGGETIDQQTVVLEDAILRAGLAEIGISDVEVEPATLNVTLKPLREVDLRVQVQTGRLPLLEDQPPTTTPEAVAVTVPIDVARDLRDSFAVARLADVVTSDGEVGEQVARDVPLEFPAAIDFDSPFVSAPMRTVQVNYTLADLDETIVVERVPIYISLPVSLQKQYVVQPRDEATRFLLDVELQGPPDVLQRIREGDPAFPVRAELVVTDPSTIESITALQPVIVTPPGVSATKTPELMPMARPQRRPTGQ